MNAIAQDKNKNLALQLAVWSSGMIPASGAGGHGFDSRNAPFIFLPVFVDGLQQTYRETRYS